MDIPTLHLVATFSATDIYANLTSTSEQPSVVDGLSYSPLDSAKDQIRICRLEPGSDGDLIECELLTNSLDDEPQYQALSYTWGDASNRQDISINGHKFAVTNNLYYALQHLRSETESKHLWIDAICINQNDIPERNEQVPRMREVYSQAQSVIVWLGRDIEPEDEERKFTMFQKWDAAGGSGDGARSARMAFDLVRKLADVWHSAVAVLTTANQEHRAGDPIIQPFNIIRGHLSQHDDIHVSLKRRLTAEEEAFWLALGRLCWRPWFDRVWVLQEVALAARTVVACGKDTICWATLLDAVGILELHSYSRGASDIIGPMLGAPKVRRMGVGKQFKDRAYGNADPSYEFLTLMSQTIQLCASNHRDKIYGMMGLLAVGTQHEMMIPDYNKPVTKVYTEFAKFVLDHQHIDILCFCNGSIEYTDLPTWAPDWIYSIPRLLPSLGVTKGSLDVFSAAGKTSSTSRFSEDLKTLIATGICIGRISNLGRLQDANPNASSYFQTILDDWEAIAIAESMDDTYSDRTAA